MGPERQPFPGKDWDRENLENPNRYFSKKDLGDLLNNFSKKTTSVKTSPVEQFSKFPVDQGSLAAGVLGEQASRLRESNARLMADNAFLQERVTNLEGWLDTARGEVERLKHRAGKDQSTIDSLQQQVDYLRREASVNDSSRINSLDPKGYYRALGIDPELARGLSAEQLENLIQGVYRAHAKVLHPDAGGDTEKMKRVNAAYDFLRDPSKRARYGSR